MLSSYEILTHVQVLWGVYILGPPSKLAFYTGQFSRSMHSLLTLSHRACHNLRINMGLNHCYYTCSSYQTVNVISFQSLFMVQSALIDEIRSS